MASTLAPPAAAASVGVSPPNRQDELRALLRTLQLSRMAGTFAALALKAAKEHLSHEAFLYELAHLEWEHRTHLRIERRLRQSGLPQGSVLLCSTRTNHRQQRIVKRVSAHMRQKGHRVMTQSAKRIAGRTGSRSADGGGPDR